MEVICVIFVYLYESIFSKSPYDCDILISGFFEFIIKVLKNCKEEDENIVLYCFL